jgi:hypothetical protein
MIERNTCGTTNTWNDKFFYLSRIRKMGVYTMLITCGRNEHMDQQKMGFYTMLIK